MFSAETSDSILLEACRNNNQQAFKFLFNRYWQPLFVAAAKRLNDRIDAKDIVQEIMAAVWLKRQALVTDENDSLESYLYTVLRYRIINYLANTEKNEPLENVMHQILVLQQSNALEGLISQELQAAIDRTIAFMPPSMQKAFLLSRQKDFSIREIAALLSLSDQTVKNLLTQALKRLRAALEKYDKDTFTEAGITFTSVLLFLYQ